MLMMVLVFGFQFVQLSPNRDGYWVLLAIFHLHRAQSQPWKFSSNRRISSEHSPCASNVSCSPARGTYTFGPLGNASLINRQRTHAYTQMSAANALKAISMHTIWVFAAHYRKSNKICVRNVNCTRELAWRSTCGEWSNALWPQLIKNWYTLTTTNGITYVWPATAKSRYSKSIAIVAFVDSLRPTVYLLIRKNQ